MPLVRTTAAVLAFCAALAVVQCVPAAESATASPKAPYRIVQRGSVMLPQSAADQAGNDVPITGLSGIAWLGDDEYVAIMDNSDRVVLFRLALANDGSPQEPTDVRVLTLAEKHDYEDLAPCPAVFQRSLQLRRVAQGFPDPGRCMLVVEEDTPAIRAISLADGSLLGVIPVPDALLPQRDNRGLESIAVEPDGESIWTCNEEALPADGPGATVDGGTVVRLTRLAIPQTDGSGKGRAEQIAYRVDPPHAFVRVFGGAPLSGVTAVSVIDNDRLLVLERSGCPGLPPFESRLYVINTTDAADVASISGGLAAAADRHTAKILIWKDQLGCNLEGMCVGPRLRNGHRALLAVADNGAIGTPNQLIGFTVETVKPSAPFPFLACGALAVVTLTALLVYRLAH